MVMQNNDDLVPVKKSKLAELIKKAEMNNNTMVKLAKEYCTIRVDVSIKITDNLNNPIKSNGFIISNVSPSVKKYEDFINRINKEIGVVVEDACNLASDKFKNEEAVKKYEEILNNYRSLCQKHNSLEINYKTLEKSNDAIINNKNKIILFYKITTTIFALISIILLCL